MLSYSRSHHRNRFQKLLAIYLKFKGISAKGFDTLHAMALTMSHKWTSDSIQRISDRCMAEVKGALADDKFPWYISYDNVNIPFRVFSQRLENQGEFGNVELFEPLFFLSFGLCRLFALDLRSLIYILPTSHFLAVNIT